MLFFVRAGRTWVSEHNKKCWQKAKESWSVGRREKRAKWQHSAWWRGESGKRSQGFVFNCFDTRLRGFTDVCSVAKWAKKTKKTTVVTEDWYALPFLTCRRRAATDEGTQSFATFSLPDGLVPEGGVSANKMFLQGPHVFPNPVVFSHLSYQKATMCPTRSGVLQTPTVVSMILQKPTLLSPDTSIRRHEKKDWKKISRKKWLHKM